jgi:hypothetical protein
MEVKQPGSHLDHLVRQTRMRHMQISGPIHKYGDVSRTPRRPTSKARGGRIPGEYLTDEQRCWAECIGG